MRAKKPIDVPDEVLWFETQDCRGKDWKVILTCVPLCGGAALGICVPGKREIRINANTPTEKIVHVLYHELVHASLVHLPPIDSFLEEVICGAVAENLEKLLADGVPSLDGRVYEAMADKARILSERT